MWERILTGVERAEEWLGRRFPSQPWEKRGVPRKGDPLTRVEKTLVGVVFLYPFVALGLGLGLSLLLELSSLRVLHGMISSAIGWTLLITGTAYGVLMILYPHHRVDPTTATPLVFLGWLLGTLWVWMGAVRLPGYGLWIAVSISFVLLGIFGAKQSLRRRQRRKEGTAGHGATAGISPWPPRGRASPP